MDQDLQARIEEARAAGYSDEEIAKVLGTQPAPAQATIAENITVPILTPEEKSKFQQQEQQATARNEEENTATGWTAAGMGAAAVGGPLLLYKGAKAVFSPVARSAADLAQRGVAAAEQANATAAATESRVAANQAARAAAKAAKPVAPTQLLDQFGRPMSTGPVAPQPMATPVAPAQAQPSMLDKTTSMIRQLAANKVFNTMAKGGIGAAAALTPGNVGQNYMVPQTGRMRGMEINPLTGRGWTREQLAQYNANPSLFDSQLPPAQMQR